MCAANLGDTLAFVIRFYRLYMLKIFLKCVNTIAYWGQANLNLNLKKTIHIPDAAAVYNNRVSQRYTCMCVCIHNHRWYSIRVLSHILIYNTYTMGDKEKKIRARAHDENFDL